jgi:hypothetical protein
MRAEPPGFAGSHENRRQVFVAALEQCEQLMRAAQTVDNAVRPLLAFYSLSQGGRALAAAASPIDNSNAWRMIGHGISVRNINDGPALPELLVAQDERGAFPTLSQMLGGGAWQRAVSVGELWAASAEYRYSPLSDRDSPPALDLSGDHSLVSVTGIPTRLLSDPRDRRAVVDYIDDHYPTLAGHQAPHGSQRVAIEILDEGWPEPVARLWLQYPPAPNGYWPSLWDRLGSQQQGTWYVIPAVGEAASPPHRLSVWWATLFALSMRARYSPAAWVGKDLDVNKNPSVVWIEQVLDEATSLIPEMLLTTIRDVTESQVPVVS